MAVRIILKNSSAEDKRPTAAQLENGEIALNYNAAGAFLTCEDTDGNIQQVGGVKISEIAPDSPVKQTLWFQPSSLTLFIYDGNSFLPIAGGGGGGTPGGGITTIIGNNGIDASEIAGVVTLDVELAGGDDGLEFSASKLKASVASASQLGSVKIGDAISVTGDGTITPRVASTSQTGIVKIGDGIDVAGDGTISVDIPQTLTFRGSVDLNNPPTGQISPDPAQGGDAYVASVGAIPIDNGWTGIGGDSAVAGDLVVFDGTEWELISTGGTMQGVEGGAGITSSTSGGIATVAVDAGTGLSFDADDKLIVDLDSGDLDGRYLRTDAAAGDQTVASTGTTTFSGLNFFKGDTYIGGSTTRNTRELWESTLTEEQKEQLAAGTLVVPANVAIPGDGEFARQWWYDQQSAEDRALIDAGELDYPEHFAAATFTDTFDLGENTYINLLSDGTVIIKQAPSLETLNVNGSIYVSSPVCRIYSKQQSRGSLQLSSPSTGERAVTYGNNYYMLRDPSDSTGVSSIYQQDEITAGGSLIQMSAPSNQYGEFLFKQKQDSDAGGAVRDVLKINNDGEAIFSGLGEFGGGVSSENWTIAPDGTATGITVTRAAVVTDEQAGTVETLLDIITDLRARVEALEAAATS